MSQSFVESLSWVPKSRGLATTLARAFDYAKAQSHRTVMLEHLLLALAADADASVVLQACNVDLGRLNGDVTNYLAAAEQPLPSGGSPDPVASPDLLRILEYASAAAQQSRRREVNGAIVLAAIVGDGRSPAASMLRAQGLTFEEAVRALQSANAARPAGQQAPQAAPHPGAAAPSVQPAQSIPEAGPRSHAPVASPPHDAPGEPAPEPRRVNGATAQSTEELLAAARRRVSSGRGPSQQPAPEPPGASSMRGHGTPHPQEPTYPEAPKPAPLPDEAPEDGASSGGEFQSRAEPPPAPRGPAPMPAPARYPPQPASMPQDAREAHRHAGAPAMKRYPEHHPPAPGPAPEWSRQAESDGYYPPQPVRGPEANHARQAPPPHPQLPPRQTPPHAHPAPPPPQRYQPGVARPMQPPWSEPPPQQIPPGPGYGARPPASARPSADPRRKAAAGGERAGTSLAAGQLVENIPRTMTVGLPETVEVRIARAEIMALAEGLQGSGAAYRHDLVVTKAMSVRLRAPEGGLWIETASPETQWIENSLGLLSEDFASWRWTVTPQRRGKSRLQLVVSARTVGADGLAAETALPDQVIEVKVRTNYGQAAAQWGGWLAAAVVGGILAKFGEGLWNIGRAVLIQFGV